MIVFMGIFSFGW